MLSLSPGLDRVGSQGELALAGAGERQGGLPITGQELVGLEALRVRQNAVEDVPAAARCAVPASPVRRYRSALLTYGGQGASSSTQCHRRRKQHIQLRKSLR